MDTEPIRQDIDTIRNSMTDKIEQIESKVRGTVEDTVSTVKETLDFKGQIAERPWTWLGASVLAGVVLGSLGGSSNSAPQRTAYPRSRGGAMPYYQSNTRPADQNAARQPEHTLAATNAWGNVPQSNRPDMYQQQSGGLLSSLNDQFGDEIAALKGAAIAAGMNTLRDLFQQNLPRFADEFQRAREQRQSQFDDQPRADELGGQPSLFERTVGDEQPEAQRSVYGGSGNATKDQVRTTASASPFASTKDVV